MFLFSDSEIRTIVDQYYPNVLIDDVDPVRLIFGPIEKTPTIRTVINMLANAGYHAIEKPSYNKRYAYISCFVPCYAD